MTDTVFKIEHDSENSFVLHVYMVAANDITFDINTERIKGDYDVIIADICNVAPHMMSLDGNLQEAYDDFFRTRPKQEDQAAVRQFLLRYHREISDSNHLLKIFGLRGI